MKFIKFSLLTFVAIFLSSLASAADKKDLVPELDWYDMNCEGLEGRAWNDTPLPFSRISKSWKDKVTKSVWNLGASSTGMCVTFETDAPEIWVSRNFTGSQLGEHNFNACSFTGFDLYCFDEKTGKMRWLATTGHGNVEKSTYRLSSTFGKRTYRIYLPLRNALKEAKVGVKKGSHFKMIPARKNPIVFYGTSIVHGAYVSHAGLSHPSVIGRNLDMPIINLGFSGAAKMEFEMAEMLAEIEASVYVIDPQANMDANMVKERCEKFLKRLRELRPNTPILLIERAEKQRDWYYGKEGKPEPMWLIQREIYQKFIDAGEKNMAYLKGEKLFGETGEASIDDVHPGDLGIMSMVEKMTPILKQLLKK